MSTQHIQLNVPLSFNQLIELVKQLSPKEKLQLSGVLSIGKRCWWIFTKNKTTWKSCGLSPKNSIIPVIMKWSYLEYKSTLWRKNGMKLSNEKRGLPFHECLVNEGWKKGGLATVVISKKMPSEKIIVGLYLIDM